MVKGKKKVPEEDIDEEELTEDEKFEKIEFEDNFNKDRAYKHVESIAIPRLVGSDGEQKAASYIKDQFKKMDLKPKEEEFEFTDWVWTVVIRIFEGLKTGLIVIAFFLIYLPNPAFLIGVVLSITLLVLTFYSSIWARFFYKFQNSEGKLFNATKFKSKNIVTKIPCTEGADNAAGDVVLLANYDSKSQTIPALLRVLIFYISLIVCVAFSIGYISAYLFYIIPGFMVDITLVRLILLILACISVGAMILLELNQTGNKSHGAINNATGVGVLLELAKIHAKKPLENMNLTFVSTGAGEMGLFGAISFLKAHESEFNKEETYFLNMKDIAKRGHLYIPGPIGFPPQLPCLEVENLFKKVLKRRQIPVKEESTTNIRVLSPWVSTGAWNDDMVAVLRGFNANRIGIGGHLRKRQIIHTKKDTIDQVDIEAIDIVGKTTAEVLKRIDLRARP